MKSPRDLLLEKHRTANPQLDAIRHRVVAGVSHRRTATAAVGSLASWLRGWLWPNPRAWAGLAAAWAVAIVLNHAATTDPNPALASTTPAPAALSSLFLQPQELHALLDPPLAPSPMPPRRSTPKPQSQISTLKSNA